MYPTVGDLDIRSMLTIYSDVVVPLSEQAAKKKKKKNQINSKQLIQSKNRQLYTEFTNCDNQVYTFVASREKKKQMKAKIR